jgi:hypothetical protein
MDGGARRELRQIRCTECDGLFWLRYTYVDSRPLNGAGVLCPDPACRKLNRIHLPETAHEFVISEEMPPVDWGPDPPVERGVEAPPVWGAEAPPFWTAEPPPDSAGKPQLDWGADRDALAPPPAPLSETAPETAFRERPSADTPVREGPARPPELPTRGPTHVYWRPPTV